jgi:hypothetical protein
MAALIGSVGPAGPMSAAGRAPVVPPVIDARGGIVVSVRIGNAGSFDFMLDTGASSSIISDDLARQIGAPIVARGEVVRSAGTELREAARLAALGRHVRGLLGQDFLSAFNYTLDV